MKSNWFEGDFDDNTMTSTHSALDSVTVDNDWDPSDLSYSNIKYDVNNTKYISNFSNMTYKNVIEPYSSINSLNSMLTLGVLNTAPIAVGAWNKDIKCELSNGPATCSDILLPTLFDHEYDTPFTFNVECSFKDGGECKDYFYVYSKKNTTDTPIYTSTSDFESCAANEVLHEFN